MEGRNSFKIKGLMTDRMADRLKDLPQEVIDTFFKTTAGDVAQKKPPKKPKKALLFIASALSLSLVLSAIILILYIIPYKQKRAGFKEARDLNRPLYAGHVVKSGLVNRQSIEEAYFDGDAAKKSAFLKNSIALTSAGTHGRASLIMRFREYIDLDDKNILILARAKYGRKKINLILKDFQNRFYEYPGIEFSPNWNLKHVYLNKVSEVDLKRIKELKLEFGSFTAGNRENSTIYLKDITVRGRRE